MWWRYTLSLVNIVLAFFLSTIIFRMLIFIPNFTLARCIYKKNQRKTGKHLKGTPSFSRAGSVLLNILRQILVLRSWLLLLCIHRHSMKVNLTHGLLHRKLVLLFVHIVTERLGGYLCSFKPFRHLFFFNGRNDFEIYYNACFPSKARKVFGCFMHTHSNCDNIS